MERSSSDESEQDHHAAVSNAVSSETMSTNVTSPKAHDSSELQEKTTKEESVNTSECGKGKTESDLIEKRTETTGNEDSTNLEGNKTQDSVLKEDKSSEEQTNKPATVDEKNSEPMPLEKETSEPIVVEEQRSEPMAAEHTSEPMIVEEQISESITAQEQGHSKDEPEKSTENTADVGQIEQGEAKSVIEHEEVSIVVDTAAQEQEKVIAETLSHIVDQTVEEQKKTTSENKNDDSNVKKSVVEPEKLTTENEEVTTVDEKMDEQEGIATEIKKSSIVENAFVEKDKITQSDEAITVEDTVDEQAKKSAEDMETSTVEKTVDEQEKGATEDQEVTVVEKTVVEQEKIATESEETTDVEMTIVEQEKSKEGTTVEKTVGEPDKIEIQITNVTTLRESPERELSKPEENVEGIAESTSKSGEGKENSDNLNEEGKEKASAEQNNKESGSEQMEQNSEDENRENPIFVHVSTGKEDDGKGGKTAEQEQEDEDFQNSQPQEDPIAADSAAVEDPKETTEDSEQGADEELCIIPDTERVISQEEKDAASALLPMAADVSSSAMDSGDEFSITTCLDDNLHSCIQCLLPRKANYISTAEQRTLYICDDKCLNAFKEDHPGKVINRVGDLRVKKLPPECAPPSSVPAGVFIRKCAECARPVSANEESTLSWETMDFCNELCLSKYQKTIASNCSYCTGEVRPNCLGKYAVRFGYDIRQFCSSLCLEEYKKGLKVCSYCQKDISVGTDGFLAPAGDKGQFKDFCSPDCMDKYTNMNTTKVPVVRPGVTCSVCLKEVPISIEYEHDGKIHLFCGEPCFVAYKFVNHIAPGKCDMCGKYFDFKVLEQQTIFYDDTQHSFCSKSCQNIYIIANRRIVPCTWCKVKKYNFDMIKRYSPTGQTLMMCSLNCLGLHQVSLNALSLKKTQCDHCMKTSQPMYHLTMSDATTRNFCSYNCVMSFQNQYSKRPLTLNEPEGLPVPTGVPKRSRRSQQKEMELPALPIISNVQSLAPIANGGTAPSLTATMRSTRTKVNAGTTSLLTAQTQKFVIIKPTPLPEVKNVMTMCKPVTVDQAVNTENDSNEKEIQTDDVHNYPGVVVLPVPIYVPVPLPMLVAAYPAPTPFPVPVPVPIFIPTTRNSANGILKEIKKIQVKIPTDPFEAELLMMAEMVAGDKKEEHTDSESEEEDTTAAQDDPSFSPEPVDASNSFGDDMLQMALKMASELDEPAVDLEGALTASTITASQSNETSANDENADEPPMSQIIARQTYSKGKKRPAGRGKGGPSKRGRRSSHASDVPTVSQQQQQQHSQVPVEPMEKPDANMCLKYTFGVNAWKQWVTTKNAELEKSTRRVKLFKPEILQLTADELNYSLCLFVKEVRKPNGAEYAPDTIYYLCLGIQQYLFENGRIDNIFCDAYYEKFTDCLDEVARKFSVLYNDSHYIVTRVEEEHLWESKQLGAHSPHVLLSTLMFFNTKHFNLTTVDEHMQLSFSHIMKHWKRNPNQPGTAKTPGSRNVLLRFYPPQTAIVNNRKKKVYEQQENEENPLRCPVKLYEFYLSKCPESVKTRNDVFYLQPERSCVPDSPVWYSTMPLPREALEKMLHRVKMVKEINVALLTS